jgi:hypothetical protein
VRRSGFTIWLTRLAWGLLAFDVLLIFLMPADTSFDSLLLLIAYAAWLISTLIFAPTWLIFRYRAFFRTWLGWATPLVSLVCSSIVVQGVLRINHPNLSLLFSLLFVVSVWSFGVATAVLLWYRDVGLGLIAWGSLVMIWIVLFAWRIQGNLIELVLSSLSHPDQPSPLWWFNPLICIWGWIIPLGAISFLAHTLRLILREFQ